MDSPSSMEGMTYLKDPAAIYRASFEAIRRETALDTWPIEAQPLAARLVHAAGMPDLLDDLRISDGAMAAGRQALAEGRPILVDATMVAAGVMQKRLPADNPVICTLHAAETPGLAATLGTTRSAAAVDLWVPHLAQAVVAIGNAPTALFRLLELLAEGAPPPALILGFPVGFIGAAESKEQLIQRAAPPPYATLQGRRGGSALAAAAVNALLIGTGDA